MLMGLLNLVRPVVIEGRRVESDVLRQTSDTLVGLGALPPFAYGRLCGLQSTGLGVHVISQLGMLCAALLVGVVVSAVDGADEDIVGRRR